MGFPTDRRRWRILPVLGWVTIIYFITAVTAPLDTSGIPGPILETRNAVIHATGYAILGSLIVWSIVASPTTDHRLLGLVVICALAVGLGQEILQVLIRHQVYPINSAFDLMCDTLGATGGWWLGNRLADRRQGSGHHDSMID
jgi:hypothetical protein